MLQAAFFHNHQKLAKKKFPLAGDWKQTVVYSLQWNRI